MWSKGVNLSAHFTVYSSGTAVYGAHTITETLNKRKTILL